MQQERTNQASEHQDDMRPQYDFTDMQGVRGKYHKAYRAGHRVKIYQEDGTISTQYFTLEDGAMIIEPDVRRYFPDAEAVNRALRTLITLVPTQPKAIKQRKVKS